ncbi:MULTISPECIES: energy transducer TonB [Vibrio]|uniref:Energy transducer TonB n=2 Tax=Vibrio alginolyticus TaxID=663 RepID=A0AA36UQC9_VIBAL|nr:MULTISPECIES: energy transducer TonB [Vibrio]MCF7507785.1 energy transducer TonB [Vibrio sp. D54]MDG2723094.1 energy transducer TonB [Vibrio parahaemolyticus]AVF68056.1 energy transducer TonB [Vibrio alginolyticus]EGQ7760762.1 energy transducer TonB [Vibrio alginolyticus]EGQ7765047.1 energy transducer TonB [Vibrio alginolyticus]
MNVQRYVIAGGASLAIHAALLFVSQETKVFAMPAGNPASSVSLNLVSAPPAVEKSTPENVAPPKEQPQDQPEPEKKIVKKQVVKKDAVKKKVVEKKPEPVKQSKPKTVEPTKTVTKQKVQPEAKPKKKTEPVKKETVAQQSAPASQSKGATSQPVLVDKPTFVSQPTQPRYPRSAQRRGIEGVALYEIWLDENGNQIKQVLIESSGTESLDASALRAIKQWQFTPHISGGLKVAHRVQVPVRFKLDG